MTSAGALWPEAGEYERTALAVLDAQIRPLMTSYLTSLRERVAAIGLRAPLFISTSNGGSVSFDDAIARPVVTVLSGPASGVAAAGLLWPATDLVTFDMGGTSSDIGVVGAGRPAVTTGTTIGDVPLTMPVVDVEAIGAGGGSVVSVDDSGEVAALRVGPRSTGAHPGPVAYGLGGTAPALTDAYVHAGALADGAFLEGRMRLDAPAASAALDALAADLDADVPDADAVAGAALRIATAGMSTRVRTVLARHGEVPDAFTFVAFGGAGGTHAALLARDLGVRRVIVPTAAATFCALGAALAPVRRDLVRSLRARLTVGEAGDPADDPSGIDEVRATARAVVAEALAWWGEQGASDGAADQGDVVLAVDARYDGQPTTLTVELRTGAPARSPRCSRRSRWTRASCARRSAGRTSATTRSPTTARPCWSRPCAWRSAVGRVACGRATASGCSRGSGGASCGWTGACTRRRCSPSCREMTTTRRPRTLHPWPDPPSWRRATRACSCRRTGECGWRRRATCCSRRWSRRTRR
ncbi:hydantoinase/oxoprolinase family protein [Litorihabitans aurantiacus]|uniref:hydantoinase/oxoprolinase family protein n=1 Tax=Litorihabitans aurantiacus TaxID=1930061 RepID=UPI0024E12A19|nr:hydantoinase/oxoprolinase family protein [Litorihabitans aurantiacus]